MSDLIDYTADLHALTDLAARPAALDELLERALDALETLVPYDLAAVFELRGDELVARTARGPLATRPVRGHRLRVAQQPTIRRALDQRVPIALREHHHAEEGDPWDGVLDLPDGHACMVVPLFAADRALGIITLDRAICQTYPDTAITIAGVYGQIVALAMLHAEQTRVLQRYRERLQEENRLLRDEVQRPGARLDDTRTPAMRRLVGQARQVAVTTAPVLILGETGVGKEVLAQAIHDDSPRRDQPFVKLNCAAIPEQLIESELFGHVKGAFTGATGRRPGRFLTANGGTLLLDEIGELPPGAQAKLLRVLQEGTFEPVGSDETARVDVRILAATHIDLAAAVQAGRFRADLWYRLDVFPLSIPPLRERPDDIIPIAESILGDIGRRSGRGPWHLTPDAARALRAHPWPGNVRQLVNALERATILRPDGALDAELFETPGRPAACPAPAAAPTELCTLAELQRRHIEAVLTRTEGKIYGDDGAARILGLKPTTLQSRMKKLGVQR
ncbi:MAG: sigma 54-interacting transcriptional regulator [bacterium]